MYQLHPGFSGMLSGLILARSQQPVMRRGDITQQPPTMSATTAATTTTTTTTTTASADRFAFGGLKMLLLPRRRITRRCLVLMKRHSRLRAPVDPRCWADEFSGQREACCNDAAVGGALGCFGGRFLYENCCLGVLACNDDSYKLEKHQLEVGF